MLRRYWSADIMSDHFVQTISFELEILWRNLVKYFLEQPCTIKFTVLNLIIVLV